MTIISVMIAITMMAGVMLALEVEVVVETIPRLEELFITAEEDIAVVTVAKRAECVERAREVTVPKAVKLVAIVVRTHAC